MSFYTSLSGLTAAQTQMSTISHNLANVDTNGFKKSVTQFADVIASSVNLSPTMMVGAGTMVKGNVQQFSQGNFIQSASALDLAISGDGFFAIKPQLNGSNVNYTRNGGFKVDPDHYVTDAQGDYLQVYPVDGSGAVVASGLDQAISLQLPTTSGTPSPTQNVGMTVNMPASAAVPTTATFDRFDPSSYNQSAQTTVYDSVGNPQTMTTYFKRETTGAPSTWSAYSFIGDKPLTSGGSDHITMSFDATGAMTAPAGATTFDPVTPAGATTA